MSEVSMDLRELLLNSNEIYSVLNDIGRKHGLSSGFASRALNRFELRTSELCSPAYVNQRSMGTHEAVPLLDLELVRGTTKVRLDSRSVEILGALLYLLTLLQRKQVNLHFGSTEFDKDWCNIILFIENFFLPGETLYFTEKFFQFRGIKLNDAPVIGTEFGNSTIGNLFANNELLFAFLKEWESTPLPEKQYFTGEISAQSFGLRGKRFYFDLVRCLRREAKPQAIVDQLNSLYRG